MKKQRKLISVALVFMLVLQLFTFVTKSNANAAGGALQVQMYMENTSPTTNTISPYFKITNNGTNSLNLSAVKIRYFYTKDGSSAQNFVCNYCVNNNSNVTGVTGTFADLTTPTPNADNYLEITFPDGIFLAPNTSIELKTSINKADGSDYTQSNDYSFNSTNTDYMDWDKATAYIFNNLIWGTEPVFDTTKGFLVVVSSKIYGDCQTELNTYMSDLVNEGWSPTLIKVNNVPDSNYAGDASFHVCENSGALKQVIRGYYDLGYKGFVLIGSAPSIPNAYWESSPVSNEKAPTDLFYADMSDWSDSDGDGTYEQPTNPTPDESVLAPDMICGRISAAGAISIPELDESIKLRMEILKTKGYLLKIHDFRLKGGQMDFDPKGFCFLEDDWSADGSEKVSALKALEKDIYCVSNKSSTNKDKFLEFLQSGYRLGYEVIHSWQEGWSLQSHPYGMEDNSLYEDLSVDDINRITAKVNYLHLDSCSACDYTKKNIGAAFLFNNADTYSTSKNSYVYNVTGDTKPAIPAINSTYYQDLKSECIGTAFKNFISNCITQNLSQDYPLYILLGDPALKYNFTKPVNTCPDILNDFSDITAYPGKPFKIAFQTEDSENDPVFLEVTGLPEEATYDSISKTVDWLPQASQSGNSYKVIATAYNKDSSGLTVNKNVQEFTIHVSRMGVVPYEIPNPGFETLNTDATPTDWTIYRPNDGNLSLDSDVKHSGNYSARITSDSYFSSYDLDINVQPNTRYLVTGYIKTSNVTTPYGTGGYLTLTGNNDQIQVSSNSIVGTQDWTQVYTYWYSGENTSLKIQCRLGGDGIAWFDDFKVEEDYNLGFEFYPNNSTTGVNKWTTFNLNYDPSAIQLDSSVKHYGLRSAEILFNQEPNFGFLGNIIPVEPNTDYRVGVWVKTSNLIGGSASLSVTTDTETLKSAPVTDAETEWRQVYLDFNSGSSTTIALKCNLGTMSELTIGTAWFDDVTIEKR